MATIKVVYEITNEDGEKIKLDARGYEVRSDDEDDDGADLADFVLDDSGDEDVDAAVEVYAEDSDDGVTLEEAQRFLAEAGGLRPKRTRRAPERFVNPDMLKQLCTTEEEAVHFFGREAVEEAKARGQRLWTQKRSRRPKTEEVVVAEDEDDCEDEEADDDSKHATGDEEDEEDDTTDDEEDDTTDDSDASETDELADDDEYEMTDDEDASEDSDDSDDDY